jgi:hypothetical protein
VLVSGRVVTCQEPFYVEECAFEGRGDYEHARVPSAAGTYIMTRLFSLTGNVRVPGDKSQERAKSNRYGIDILAITTILLHRLAKVCVNVHPRGRVYVCVRAKRYDLAISYQHKCIQTHSYGLLGVSMCILHVSYHQLDWIRYHKFDIMV